MATNRHLSCGALELTGVAWEHDTLSGRSVIPADEPYILYLYEPKGFAYGTLICGGAAFLGTTVSGGIREIRIRGAGVVSWKVVYKKEGD
jgi:hypothetical protein